MSKKKQEIVVLEEKMPSLKSPASMRSFAIELKQFIVKLGLYTEIQKKNYVNVEGWQFAGASMGLVAVVDSCERIADGRPAAEIAYRAVVVVYSGERPVSRGIAVCSSKESKKASFDEYAIASMAQTRAVGKAYRLLLGWMMKAAGYEGTPAEEMKQEQPAAKTSGGVKNASEKEAVAVAEAQIAKTSDKGQLERFKSKVMDSQFSDKAKSRLVDIIQAKIDA